MTAPPRATRNAAPPRAAPLPVRLALFAAAATLLWLVESAVNPVPWLRLGLANAVTLFVLLEHGAGAAALVLALRLVLGALFAGAFLGPAFVLACGGGAASLAVMALVARWGRRWWSPVGLSVWGACAHVTAQLVLVDRVLGAGSGAWDLLPLFLAVGLVGGVCTGWFVDVLQARLALARDGRSS